jgi:hypothetical protein
MYLEQKENQGKFGIDLAG